MALHVRCSDPAGVLQAFKDLIESNRVVTWIIDSDGDFTHATKQWINLAWMRPQVEQTELVFNMIRNTQVVVTSELYAIYHGRLAESLLAHLDTRIDQCRLSSMPEHGDRITTVS